MARADLIHDPMLTGQGPQRNTWFAGPGPSKADFDRLNAAVRDVSVPPAETFTAAARVGGETLFFTRRGVYRVPQKDDAYEIGGDMAYPEVRIRPWALYGFPIIAGLLVAVAAWLRWG